MPVILLATSSSFTVNCQITGATPVTTRLLDLALPRLTDETLPGELHQGSRPVARGVGPRHGDDGVERQEKERNQHHQDKGFLRLALPASRGRRGFGCSHGREFTSSADLVRWPFGQGMEATVGICSGTVGHHDTK